jgi:hypothetical protein
MYLIAAGFLLVSYASASFVLQYPPAQSTVSTSGSTWPCGEGGASSGVRTVWYASGGRIQLQFANPRSSVQVRLNLAGNPNNSTAMGTSFVVEGLGAFCFPRYVLSSVAWNDGDNATIQFVTDGPQYQVRWSSLIGMLCSACTW